MKRVQYVLVILCLAWAVMLMADPCFAYDTATFESFYKESSIIGWALTAVIALGAAVAVYCTGGLASPFVSGPVAGAGSMIGGTMGLSGAAATNAGLAFLGGGSIAAGGLGMAGGAALLTGAFTFGSGVVMDYGISKIMAEYSYSSLQEEAKNMPNLPPFVNADGPDCMEEAAECFEKYYKAEELPGSETNQRACAMASNALTAYDGDFSDKEKARVYAAKALVAFMMNDFQNSATYAHMAVRFAPDKDEVTVPEFIMSVSGFVAGRISRWQSVEYFENSIKNEPDNPLHPLMYSIYLSRIGAMNLLDEDVMHGIMSTMSYIKNKDMYKDVYLIMEAAYISNIKLCQSNITILSQNKDNGFDRQEIKNRARKELAKYKALVKDVDSFMRKNEGIFGKDSKNNIYDKKVLIFQYQRDTDRLERLYNEI